MHKERRLNESLIQEIIAPPVSKAINYSLYEETIRTFVDRDCGRFHILTRDKSFTSFLRKTITTIAPTPKALSVIRKEDELLRHLRVDANHGRFILLLVDEEFIHESLGAVLHQIKAAFETVKIIVLSNETSVDEIALLHEKGADNFIVKPISTNSLVVKLAFTIKPHGAIGKHIDAGKSMLANGKWKLAMKMADKVLGIKPDSAAAFMLKGDALVEAKCPDEAREAYEAACDSAHMYLEPLKKLAKFHGTEGDSDCHLKYLQRLDDLSPLNVDRKVSIGKLYLDLGDADNAEATFEDVMDIVTQTAMAEVAKISMRIADAYMSKDPGKSEEFYKKALNTKGFDPKSNIGIFNSLGTALRKQGKWREALEQYDCALDLSPDDENLYYNKAMAHADGGNSKEAFNCMQRALEINKKFLSRSHIIALNCAVIASGCGRKNRAAAMCRVALKINPDYGKAKKLLKKLTGESPGLDMLLHGR